VQQQESLRYHRSFFLLFSSLSFSSCGVRGLSLDGQQATDAIELAVPLHREAALVLVLFRGLAWLRTKDNNTAIISTAPLVTVVAHRHRHACAAQTTLGSQR
jgi:hypothetical protein